MTDTPNPEMIEWWQGLGDQLHRFDAIICDLWGVIHDGINLHENAVEAIAQARGRGVRTIFLTNAPRPRTAVRDQLARLGVPQPLLDEIVTSGGLARDLVRRDYEGAKIYHMGTAEDHHLTLQGLPAQMVESLSDADIIFATDGEPIALEEHYALLKPLAERGVPFLCANPDKVVHVGDTVVHCAGAVADIYQELGGPVIWFGKPQPIAYTGSLDQIGYDGPMDRVLMIGDSLRTDITGANAVGLQSLLLTGGIHRDDFADMDTSISRAAFEQKVGLKGVFPTALMNKLKI